MMKILLCGFMGAGKSTLLERLKSDPSVPIIDDLDQLIAERFAASYEDLDNYISRVGWQSFRAQEGQMLTEWVRAKFSEGVLSLGGGTLEYHAELIFESPPAGLFLVWLDTPFEICLQRVRSGMGRPLAKLSDQELFELYQKRCLSYQRAHARLTPEEADKIFTVQQLQNTCKK